MCRTKLRPPDRYGTGAPLPIPTHPTAARTNTAVGQPDGSSLLCLSCHDGTIALGELRSRGVTNVAMGGGVTTMPLGVSNLTTNLSNHHPVSFVYNAALATTDGQLYDPSVLTGAVKLQATKVQCSSCHDAHNNTFGKFLVVSNTASALCVTCHNRTYWSGSDHRNSTKTWNGTGTNPWLHTPATQTTVASNACENCHMPHAAGGQKRILNYAAEEANCYTCHSGTVAAKNMVPEFSKLSKHNVAGYTGTHDPVEPATTTTAHVECVDCHNPHAAYASSPPAGSIPAGTTTPALAGSQIGVRGVDINGAAVNPATAEYQICFRCHADGGAANIPASAFARKIAQNNKRLEFTPANMSHHAVAGPRAATGTVPSLLATSPWKLNSQLRCTDCHNNNAGPYSAGTPVAPTGAGVNGPHGSTEPWLLERRYDTADNTTESLAAYALCYKCHNRANILADNSFKEHSKHIVSEKAPCSVCHDPHGISSTQGMSNANGNSTNRRLMNFRTDVVTPSGGNLYWSGTGNGSGTCYLNCHGKNHNPLSY